MRQKRQYRQMINFNPVKPQLLTSLTGSAVYPTGQAVSTGSLPYIGYAGAAFAAGMIGLFYLNRLVLKYRRAKIHKNVITQKDIVHTLARKLGEIYPTLSLSQRVEISIKMLEARQEKMEDDKKRRFKVDPETGNVIDNANAGAL